MKKIVITGGAGFIGRSVVKQLLKRNYKLRIVDNLSGPSSKIDKGYEFVMADLTDPKQAEKAFLGMDICINLAAKIGGIGYFNKNPATIISDNNKIYSSTFKAAVKNKLERMVYVSSSMVYESTSLFPSKESDVNKIPLPFSAYGFSKLIGERYCHAYWEQYSLPFSICRPFNAYGKDEQLGKEIGHAHVIPDLTKKILDGQNPLEILGDGNQIRSFTAVDDIASGIIAVMENEKGVNEDFNIANPKPIKMNDLAHLIWNIVKPKEKLKIKHVDGFPFDVKVRIPDTKKITSLIGWKPTVSFEEGLKETVLWIKKIYEDKKQTNKTKD